MTAISILMTIVAMATAGSPGLGEVFSLRVGDSVSIEGTDLRLRFTEVASDSRCPKDASCFVAGHAQVVVNAELERESLKMVFRVPPAGSDSQKFARFNVTIITLDPQTTSTRRIEAADYVAKMKVTAAKP